MAELDQIINQIANVEMEDVNNYNSIADFQDLVNDSPESDFKTLFTERPSKIRFLERIRACILQPKGNSTRSAAKRIIIAAKYLRLSIEKRNELRAIIEHKMRNNLKEFSYDECMHFGMTQNTLKCFLGYLGSPKFEFNIKMIYFVTH